MATNSVHPTEGDLAVVIKWLQEESATIMQGAKTSVAPNTVAATIVNADSAVDPTTTEIATAPVDGAASRKRQRSESTSSHSAEDFDDAKTVETSVTEGDEREEDDEDEEYEEDEDCNCSRCVPPLKKRTHRAGRGSASPQPEDRIREFDFRGQVYQVPYYDMSVAGFHFVRNMVLESQRAVARDGKDSKPYDLVLGFGATAENR